MTPDDSERQIEILKRRIMTLETSAPPPAPTQPLVCRRAEACMLLGGISTVALWRLEKRGFITAVPNTGTKLYSFASLRDFVAGKAPRHLPLSSTTRQRAAAAG